MGRWQKKYYLEMYFEQVTGGAEENIIYLNNAKKPAAQKRNLGMTELSTILVSTLFPATVLAHILPSQLMRILINITPGNIDMGSRFINLFTTSVYRNHANMGQGRFFCSIE